jgi:hypothetical protein
MGALLAAASASLPAPPRQASPIFWGEDQRLKGREVEATGTPY